MATISFDLVSPEKLLFNDEVGMIIVPGKDGDIGVLPGHSKVLSSLRPGRIMIYGEDKNLLKSFFVTGGFVEINPEKCIVLAEEVKKGNFRQDLYYRLLGLPIDLPPLRDRGNDILILAKLFLERFAKANKTPSTLSKEAKNKLLDIGKAIREKAQEQGIQPAAFLGYLVAKDPKKYGSLAKLESIINGKS